MAPIYKKLTHRKATKVDGEVAEIKDADQLKLIRQSFVDKIAEIDADLAEMEKVGISAVAPAEPKEL